MKSIIVISLFPFIAVASNCEKKDIKIIFDKKPVLTQEVVCTKKTSDNMIFYVSKNCADDKCDILKKTKKELTIKSFDGNIGSPGFKLCEELGGVPQIFEYKKSQEKLWQNSERCLFPNENFVEISLLMKEWKDFVKL